MEPTKLGEVWTEFQDISHKELDAQFNYIVSVQ